MTLGDCFFTPESDVVRRHLWIVVSDPTKDSSVVIVNVSTKPSPSAPPGDRTRVIAAGMHRFIGRESFLRCELARLVELMKLEQLLRNGKLSPTQAASVEFVAKAQAILGVSRETRFEVNDTLRRQGFIA